MPKTTEIYNIILAEIQDAERMILGEHTSEDMAKYYQGKIHALRTVSQKIAEL